ncbi:astacin-like metalloprotease toxin 1 [Caerostris darwini]|uniref:Metalloendopeptidase n=1 Tax=Caerostris darwini TaxID=1538125 RepID=A0AAV4RSZ3_9ARAC|nr:astacin-like metalloprotease toxin 1 [Caerostris darwini]
MLSSSVMWKMATFPLVAALLLYWAVCFAADDELVWNDSGLENPDLFEGDILGVDPEDRNAIVGEEKLWPAGVIPYELDNGLSSTVSLSLLQRAMWKYGNKTCVRFVPRTKEPVYLHIFPGQGCYSYVGRKKAEGGAQPLSLGKGCNHLGTMLHELGHAVGFYHEHSRSDRDDWITIHWENIKEGTESQFFKLKPERNQLLTPFDYNSIMLYGSYTFSREKGKFITMVAKDGRLLDSTRQKTNLAKNDAVRIKKLYKCKGKQVAS